MRKKLIRRAWFWVGIELAGFFMIVGGFRLIELIGANPIELPLYTSQPHAYYYSPFVLFLAGLFLVWYAVWRFCRVVKILERHP